MSSFAKKCLFISGLFLVLTACADNTVSRGYNYDKLKESKALLSQGTLTKQYIAELMGSPSATSDFGGERWYYINSKMRTVAFLPPKLVDQTVLAIAFDENGTAVDIKEYSKADARKLEISKDYTPTEGHSVTVIQQLLGNVGRFNNQGNMPGTMENTGAPGQ